MHSTNERPREPIVNAPTIVLVLLAVLIAIHAVRDWLPSDVDASWFVYLAFVPARISDVQAAGWLAPGYSSLLTHALLHGDWLHLTVNGAWLLAFGSLMARRCGVFGFLMLFALSAVAGALFFWMLHLDEVVGLVGASGGISGLMGGAFRLIFLARDFGGIDLLREHPNAVPRVPLRAALAHRATLTATIVWLGINLLFGLGASEFFQSGSIAWEAHMGGFLFGFLAFGWFDRGPGITASPVQDGSDQY